MMSQMEILLTHRLEKGPQFLFSGVRGVSDKTEAEKQRQVN